MANNLDNFVPEIWSRNVVANIDQVNVAMAAIANNNYEGEIAAFGDTVQVRTFGNVTVQNYQRGQTLSPEDLAPTKETLTVDQAKAFVFDVDDLDKVQNDISAIQGYTGRAGVAVSNNMDSYAMSFYSSAHANNQLSNGGSAYDISANTAGTAAYELFVNAGVALDTFNVPSDQRWIIVSPYVKGLLLKSTTYLIRASDLGDAIVSTARIGMTARDAMARGYVGQAAGFDIWCSTNLATNGSNRYMLYGQGKPLSFAAQIQPGSVEAIRLPDTFATRVRGLVLYGGKVFAEDSKRLGYIYVDNS